MRPCPDGFWFTAGAFMNILILNITRFGDLLQSQAAVNALAYASVGANGMLEPPVPALLASGLAGGPMEVPADGLAGAPAGGLSGGLAGGLPGGLTDSMTDNQTGRLAPRNRVALVCLANFASATSFLHNIHHYFPLPKDAFLSALMGEAGLVRPAGPSAASPDCENWSAALAQLWQWREQILEQFRPDLVCNLTPTVPARLLAAFLASGPEGLRGEVGEALSASAMQAGASTVQASVNRIPVSGFAIDEHGFAVNGAWASYLQGASRNRSLSPFNVVDVFRAVAGQSIGIAGDTALTRPSGDDCRAMESRLGAGLPEVLRNSPQAESSAPAVHQINGQLHGQMHAQMRDQMRGQQSSQARGFVGFQLGASEQRRQWPLEYFARLGQQLWHKLGFVPVLLGSKGEMHLAEGYAGLSKTMDADAPFVSLVGSTNLAELAAALCNCSLLVSNDTGTMHMAAGLGRPVLGIFLATAQPWDTGPGLAGSCTLEPGLACHPCAFGQKCPHDHICRLAVDPDTVFTLTESFLQRGVWSESGSRNGASGTSGVSGVSGEHGAPDAAGATGITGHSIIPGKIVHTAEGARYEGPLPRVWLTETDERGFFTLRSLSGHDGESRSIWFREQRAFLRRFLDHEPLPVDEAADLTAPDLPAEVREKLSAELTYFDGRLGSLLDQGRLLSLKPLPRFRELFMESLRELTRNFEESQFLGTVGFLWRIEVHEQGVDLDAAMSCIDRYKALISGLLRRFM
ncbi:glycosyltransferase family 9 protein [Desulfovibrio sp. OttesenSCG-928-C06]|nr:glycosyltransferase family 9 protein [Desulfovibrio sp. OttesenSCG-928-C06]